MSNEVLEAVDEVVKEQLRKVSKEQADQVPDEDLHLFAGTREALEEALYHYHYRRYRGSMEQKLRAS